MSRRHLERQPGFNELSADVGLLNEDQFDQLLDDHSDQALELLAMMTQATDRTLAALAKRLAGRLMLDLTTAGQARSSGIGRLVTQPAGPGRDDLDIDASLDAIADAAGRGRRPDLADLYARAWARPQTAICLVVDRSGSMDGSRLATAALAAAACTWRAPDHLSILAFSDRVLTIKDIGQPGRPETLVNTVLSLRGHGTTDIALALETAERQINRTDAKRKVVLLLSDGESTAGDDPSAVARRLSELVIIAPADEPDHASALATKSRSTFHLIDDPMTIVPTLNNVLS